MSVRLRTAILGVGHWHAKFVFETLRRHSHVVAVSEPDPALLATAAGALDCRAYADPVDLLDREQVDAVFVYGRHCDMAALADEVIGRAIPFVLEKPGGMNADQVAGLRDRARAAGLFAAVPFTHRLTPWVREIVNAGPPGVRHAQFRLLSGPASRYRAHGVPWAVNRAEAGGGCTINLSVLFVDLFRHLTGQRARLDSARMLTLTPGIDVEDYSTLVVSSADGASVATIETGYTFPTGSGSDLSASVRTAEAYHLVSGDFRTVTRATGEPDSAAMATHHRNYYGQFAHDTLRAIGSGGPPLASLDDLHEAMVVVDAAYGAAQPPAIVDRR
ncbi:Gfo/Idh/MocA family oxidoreductase [Micromonospora sp. WMMD1082]|uniref:Gfo/Idh/MocA family protein n=1 Tax=Micromonospora sp. WMMD1082 TaxID=3016104 RepID=UPI00241649F0|nr:Gfo/Idh/MocA family oxidoreductase [Micromonospora sp. WMMD1082]MDG4798357.1 Gfo/Idh/MocA family oxidoreductase [Micromonospora sp. WMMD1082]